MTTNRHVPRTRPLAVLAATSAGAGLSIKVLAGPADARQRTAKRRLVGSAPAGSFGVAQAEGAGGLTAKGRREVACTGATPRRIRLPATGLASAFTFLVPVIAFGMLGLLAMAPALRTRRHSRAAVCDVCRRNHRRWMAVSGALASLTLVGAGLRLAHLEPTVPACPVTSISSGTSVRDLHDNRESGLGPALHRVLAAPVSGLAIAYARWQGDTLCDVHNPSITVAFAPKAASAAGATYGEVFVFQPPLTLDDAQAKRFIRHEARHSDQWAALTALGGISLLPIAYAVDESIYPGSLNHFEESAGLADGAYRPAPEPRPGPRPSALVMWGLVTVVVLRTRLRLLLRTVAGRPRPPAPQRCGRHTPGW